MTKKQAFKKEVDALLQESKESKNDRLATEKAIESLQHVAKHLLTVEAFEEVFGDVLVVEP